MGVAIFIFRSIESVNINSSHSSVHIDNYLSDCNKNITNRYLSTSLTKRHIAFVLSRLNILNVSIIFNMYIQSCQKKYPSSSFLVASLQNEYCYARTSGLPDLIWNLWNDIFISKSYHFVTYTVLRIVNNNISFCGFS